MDIVERLRTGQTEGSHLRFEAAGEIERLRRIEAAARDVANTLNGGFIRCPICGAQETTTDLDFAPDLYAALGIEQADH